MKSLSCLVSYSFNNFPSFITFNCLTDSIRPFWDAIVIQALVVGPLWRAGNCIVFRLSTSAQMLPANRISELCQLLPDWTYVDFNWTPPDCTDYPRFSAAAAAGWSTACTGGAGPPVDWLLTPMTLALFPLVSLARAPCLPVLPSLPLTSDHRTQRSLTNLTTLQNLES